MIGLQLLILYMAKIEELEESVFYQQILSNIKRIMRDRGLTQQTLAEYIEVGPSQFSKIIKGSVGLSMVQLSKLATSLSMREIDIITYPEVYVKPESKESEPVEAILQIKLKKDKKDQVLKLVFGDNNIEILNK